MKKDELNDDVPPQELQKREDHPIVERAPISDSSVTGEKNRALLPILRAFAEEVESRIEGGSLKKELGEMRTTQILFHLGKLAQALKGPAIQIANVVNPPNQDKLRAFSPRMQTPRERELNHKRMDRKLDK